MNETLQKVVFENMSDFSNITNITNSTSSFIANTSSSFLNNSNVSSIAFQVDPNWFYSASAQSAAAIVGLMGAFTTTKLINHKSFITQIKKEISECKTKIKSIDEEIETKNIYIANFEYETKKKLVDGFLRAIAFEINPDTPFSLDKLYEMSQTRLEYQSFKDIDKTILTEKYNEAYLESVRAIELAIGEELFEETPIDKEDEWAKYQIYQKYQQDVIEKKAERSFYRTLLTNKHRIVSSEDQEIMGIRDYLFVLFLFSLTGIFLPLLMMLWSYETMMQYRTITYFLILCGWLMIIGQLYFSVVNLLKNNNLQD